MESLSVTDRPRLRKLVGQTGACMYHQCELSRDMSGRGKRVHRHSQPLPSFMLGEQVKLG